MQPPSHTRAHNSGGATLSPQRPARRQRTAGDTCCRQYYAITREYSSALCHKSAFENPDQGCGIQHQNQIPLCLFCFHASSLCRHPDIKNVAFSIRFCDPNTRCPLRKCSGKTTCDHSQHVRVSLKRCASKLYVLQFWPPWWATVRVERSHMMMYLQMTAIRRHPRRGTGGRKRMRRRRTRRSPPVEATTAMPV